MVIANLTLRGGHAQSTLFYSLSLGYSVLYLFTRGEVESANTKGQRADSHSLYSLLNTMSNTVF